MPVKTAPGGDPGQLPEAATQRRRLPAWFALPLGGWRGGALLGALVCAILLVAGVRWVGVMAERQFLAVPRSVYQSEQEKAGKPAIAVLPLANQNQNSAHEYFADGLTQDLINALGRFSALTVISWNGVFPYKEKPASPEVVGRALGVGYLVEGSTRQSGNRVQVIAQLVETRHGRVLWSTRLDEALAVVATKVVHPGWAWETVGCPPSATQARAPDEHPQECAADAARSTPLG